MRLTPHGSPRRMDDSAQTISLVSRLRSVCNGRPPLHAAAARRGCTLQRPRCLARPVAAVSSWRRQGAVDAQWSLSLK
eukprot:9334119-Alexandrium_andersonii.AAC.1